MTRSVIHHYGKTLGHNKQSTSIAAAKRSEPNAGTDARRVLDYIRYGCEDGATDDEVEIALEMRHQTASARRRGLVLTKWLKNGGEKRPTRSGSLAIVWVLAEEVK